MYFSARLKKIRGLDPAVKNFLQETGISDPTEITALNNLTKELKTTSLWEKMYVIYPFVGGTASTHSYNLINTSANQITWNGTVTHNTNGITGDGSSGYGQTGFTNTVSNQDNISFGLYSRTESGNTKYEMGCFNSSSVPVMNITDNIRIRISDELFTSASAVVPKNFPHTNGQGNFAVSRVNSTEIISNNSSTISTVASVRDGVPDLEMYVLGLNFDDTIFGASDKNIAFTYISEGLSSSELSSLDTIIQTFQTTLGREV